MGLFQKSKATRRLMMLVSHDGYAPHFTAAEAARLVAQGADVNIRMPEGYTPLAHVAVWNNTGVAQVLLNHGADPNGGAWGREKMIPLAIAAQNGHEEMLSLLIAKGADVNARDEYGNTPLHRAVGPSVARQSNVIEVLLDHDANPHIPNEDGRTPLQALEYMVSVLVPSRPIGIQTQADCDRADRELLADLERLTVLLR